MLGAVMLGAVILGVVMLGTLWRRVWLAIGFGKMTRDFHRISGTAALGRLDRAALSMFGTQR